MNFLSMNLKWLHALKCDEQQIKYLRPIIYFLILVGTLLPCMNANKCSHFFNKARLKPEQIGAVLRTKTISETKKLVPALGVFMGNNIGLLRAFKAKYRLSNSVITEGNKKFKKSTICSGNNNEIIFYNSNYGYWKKQSNTAVLDAAQFGIIPDGDTSIKDASIAAGSNILTSFSTNFTRKDVGKTLYVTGAGLRTNHYVFIASIIDVSKHQVTLSYNASTTVKNAKVTYGTENSVGLIAMNNAARKIKDKNVNLVFHAGGFYLSKFNNWLAGIKSQTIKGNGARFICTSAAYPNTAYSSTNNALCMPTPFDNIDNGYLGDWSSHHLSSGTKINSATVNDDHVLLKSGDSLSTFQVGGWALIYGYEMANTGGFPDAERYFEYKKIKSINADTKTIYFTSSLKNTYDAGWPDSTWTGGTTGTGAPRIISCNRPTFTMVDSFVMSDVKFIRFPQYTWLDDRWNGRVAFYGIINGHLKNIEMTGCYIGNSKEVTVENCIFSKYIEPDQQVEKLTFDGCTFGSFGGAPGIAYLTIKNCRLYGYFGIVAITAVLDNNYFFTQSGFSRQSLMDFAANGGCDNLILGTNHWNFSNPEKSFILNKSGNTKLVVTTLLDSATVMVKNSAWAAAKNGRGIRPGRVGKTASGKMVNVTRVYQYKSGLIAIKGIYSSPPTPGDIFIFNYLPRIEVRGKQLKEGNYGSKARLFADSSVINTILWASPEFQTD